ncbi:MAG: hypothetical protein HYU64_03815 [Armatimonadetes bacterium]|nr:hypothetical protein [Armatimonadota bacterium]
MTAESLADQLLMELPVKTDKDISRTLTQLLLAQETAELQLPSEKREEIM